MKDIVLVDGPEVVGDGPGGREVGHRIPLRILHGKGKWLRLARNNLNGSGLDADRSGGSGNNGQGVAIAGTVREGREERDGSGGCRRESVIVRDSPTPFPVPLEGPGDLTGDRIAPGIRDFGSQGEAGAGGELVGIGGDPHGGGRSGGDGYRDFRGESAEGRP